MLARERQFDCELILLRFYTTYEQGRFVPFLGGEMSVPATRARKGLAEGPEQGARLTARSAARAAKAFDRVQAHRSHRVMPTWKSTRPGSGWWAGPDRIDESHFARS